MKKQIATLISSISTIVVVIVLLLENDNKKIWFILIASITTFIISTLEIFDLKVTQKKNNLSRLKSIQDNFDINYRGNLEKYGIIESGVQLTNAKIYLISKDMNSLRILEEHKLIGITKDLKEFKSIYEIER